MSESMPILANTAAASSQSKELSNGGTSATTDAESADSNGGFPKLLETQLQTTQQDSESGNDLPPDMASPAQAAMLPLELFQVQNNADGNAPLPGQAAGTSLTTAVSAATIGGDKLANVALSANAEDSLNLDETLLTRQQQQLMQTVTSGAKDSPSIDSLLKQHGSAEAASQAPLPASVAHNNNLTMAGLATGLVAKADAMPTQSAPAMTVPQQHPGWNQAVGDRLQWMVGHHIQSADIRLDPPELGRLDVHIQLHKDHASIVFSAPNQQVRDALESAVPRLREMMNDIGLSLGDVNVSQESFSQGQQANENSRSADSVANDEAENDRLEAISPIAVRRGIGMLDAYA
ncbi:Flagellar hook-length control protein FliK [hydrothermal vent metagenome]|uniref:Flagellar hook-length control protein FliK n=1 Tax=hydrothermal vent metagenome TaxID=652676 RepID=A0A3B1BIC2_9ZZZZ